MAVTVVSRTIALLSTMYLSQVWAWYEVSSNRWKLLQTEARRRYREFVALQNALEANPAFSVSLKGNSFLVCCNLFCKIQFKTQHVQENTHDYL